MLPGIAPVPSQALTALTFITSAESSTSTITIPATAKAGDLAVYMEQTVSASLPTDVTPTGFLDIVKGNLSTVRANTSYKVLGSSDPGASLTGMSGTSSTLKLLLVFRPNIPKIRVVGIGTPASELNGADPSAQSILSGGQIVPVIAICHFGKGTAGVWTGQSFSPTRAGVVQHSAGSQECWYKIYNAGSLPANIATDLGDTGNLNTLQSFFLSPS
jgi:hypothetical protein